MPRFCDDFGVRKDKRMIECSVGYRWDLILEVLLLFELNGEKVLRIAIRSFCNARSSDLFSSSFCTLAIFVTYSPGTFLSRV